MQHDPANMGKGLIAGNERHLSRLYLRDPPANLKNLSLR